MTDDDDDDDDELHAWNILSTHLATSSCDRCCASLPNDEFV